MKIQRGLVLIMACGIVVTLSGSASAFRLDTRWTSTATNGGGLTQGRPTTLTWSFVPDGTNIPADVGFPARLSDFIVQFDTRFGAGPGGEDLTLRPWFTYFQQSFDRWGELGGLSYVYEPGPMNGIAGDDGVAVGTASGLLGVRGDVRISGKLLDGASNVLAYNNFPQNGDMVLDTGDMAFFGNTANNRRQLRNVVMHEHGHGMGLRHVESNNAGFLMEPFISTAFDGPQLDDVRGMHRHYGDKYEENGGNDTAATATNVGVFGDGGTFRVGFDGRTTFVASTEIDFISIDDNSDVDYLGFTLSGNSLVTLSAAPVGSSYLEAPQTNPPTAQTTLNAAQISDLTLALIGSDQSTQLAISQLGGLGVTESINGFSLNAGTYYARITGTADNIQMYEFNLSVTQVMTIDGDFDNNGLWNCDDIDALSAVSAAMSNNTDFDLNGDGLVNSGDIDAWLIEGGANNPAATGGNAFLIGDADLSGDVDGADFILWNAGKFTNNSAWCSGNFNGDAVVDGTDFIAWNANKFTSSDAALLASAEEASPEFWDANNFTSSDAAAVFLVPEPSSLLMLTSVVLWGAQRRRLV